MATFIFIFERLIRETA